MKGVKTGKKRVCLVLCGKDGCLKPIACHTEKYSGCHNSKRKPLVEERHQFSPSMLFMGQIYDIVNSKTQSILISVHIAPKLGSSDQWCQAYDNLCKILILFEYTHFSEKPRKLQYSMDEL